MRVLLAVLVALALLPSAAMARDTTGTVRVSDSSYGPVLFDGEGYTLYLFAKERKGKSRCYGECALAWPPFVVKGMPHAGEGTHASLLGTTRRRGGRRQLTYGGHPVYYYRSEDEPGEIFCQNVVNFGGTWLLVSPAGDAIV
jgi:predicted lipoprotein with Yx(FWY)xxD motif